MNRPQHPMNLTHLHGPDGTINTVGGAFPKSQAEAIATTVGFLCELAQGTRLREVLVRIVQRPDGTWAVLAHVNRLPELRAVGKATAPEEPR